MNVENKFSKNTMLVSVRIRPLNKKELQYSSLKTLQIENDKIKIISSQKQKQKEIEFEFDFIFSEEITQKEIYEYTTEKLINKVMEGFNATIFAFGATGSGKTYTMVGNNKENGIMIRSINDLFLKLNNEKNKDFSVYISYIEVYNEQLKDLLNFNNENNNNLNNNKFNNNNNNNIEIRNDPQKGIIIQGTIIKKVNNAEETYKLLNQGNKKRTENSTLNNENSSRSHAILQIFIKSENSTKNTFGKFFLVDLAGSEKISILSKSNNESGKINKSLLALTNCINKLISNKKNFIPYRDSKLTRILQDSLSGNCKIVMIATVSQSLLCLDETIFTLNYANKARNIKINLKKNFVDDDNFGYKKYEQIVQKLKNEINFVKNEIFEKEKINMSDYDILISNNNINDNNIINNFNKENLKDNHFDDFDKFQKEIISNFEEEIKIKKDIIEKEKEIENLKNEISENEFKIVNYPTLNINLLKKEINNLNNEIINIKKNLSNNYNLQSNLFNKRINYQNKISLLLKKDKDSIQSKNLISIFKYYTSYLENINSEHRKFINACELKRQDQKIKVLKDQINLRDDFIINAGNEIIKNKGTFKYKNPKLLSLDEIDLNPYKSKLIKVYSNLNNIINNDDIKSKSNNNLFHTPIINNKIIRRIQSPKEKLKITKKRQFNEESELKPLIKNKNSSMSFLGKFKRKNKLRFRNNNLSPNLISNGINTINNIANVYNKSGYFFNEDKFRRLMTNNYNNYKQSLRNYHENNILRVKTFSSDYKDVFSNNQSFDSEFSLTTKLENDIQKKVKTILGKNILGRYKKSPYLKIFNQ